MASLSLVRPYFRTHLKALGYSEHKDAFNYENIPSTIIDGSFHIETPTGGRKGLYTNGSQPIEQDCVVRVWVKGYRNPATAIDTAMEYLEEILDRVLDANNRIGTGIKNIYYSDNNIKPYAASNDNIVLLEITFTCLMEIST